MKKVYLCAIALSVGSLSFGQAVKQNTTPFKSQATLGAKTSTQAPQDKGATLWSNDFTTPGDWTATAVVAPDNWIIGTGIAPSGAFLINPLVSTSGGNFAMFDSDLMCSGGQDATLTINTPINLSANANVSLQFEQYYRKFQCTTYVGVSTNGGASWTDIEVNANIGVNDFNDADANSNPNTQTVNISASAGGQAAVLIRFHFVGGCDYSWMVDDVKIVETDDNDMVASEGFYGFGPNLIQYTRIPVAQITSSDFSVKTTNVGSVNQTNAMLTADVNGGTFTGTSATVTNNTGATDSLVSTTQYTPAVTVGVPLNITLTVSSDSTDASPTNNIMTFSPIEVSQYVYAHDDYSGTPGNGGGYNTTPTPPTEDFEAGNYFDIIANQTAYAIDVSIGTNTQVGAIIDVVLYDGAFVQLDRSNVYVVTAGDLGNMVTLTLPAQPALNAGDLVFAAVHGWGGTTFEFFYGVSGSSVGNGSPSGPTSLIFYPNMATPNTGENFFTTGTPMVRLNFDPNIGINEVANDVSFSVYPNPSTGEFTINLANTTKNVNLTVKNVVGKTIIDRTVSGSTKETISLSDYSKGIYFLTINNETTKLIVE